MKEIRLDGKLNYIINDIGFVNVLRNKDYKFNVKNGKEVYTMNYVVSGNMNYFFIKTGKSVNIEDGELLLIPKHYPYTATYTMDNTVAKGLTFDISSDCLPEIFKLPICRKDTEFSDVFESLSGERVNSISYLASKIYELLYLLEKSSVKVPDKFKKIIPAVDEIRLRYYDNKNNSITCFLCNYDSSWLVLKKTCYQRK